MHRLNYLRSPSPTAEISKQALERYARLHDHSTRAAIGRAFGPEKIQALMAKSPAIAKLIRQGALSNKEVQQVAEDLHPHIVNSLKPIAEAYRQRMLNVIRDKRTYKREAAEAVLVDKLTGLRSRHAFDLLASDYQESVNKGPNQEFSTVLVDVDRFKEINDRLGHPEGDRVLRALGSVMNRTLEGFKAKHKIPNELLHVARLGGDEAAFVGKIPLKRASELAVLVQAEWAKERMVHENADPITLSMGIAKFRKMPASIDSSEPVVPSAYEHADNALYISKGPLLKGGAIHVLDHIDPDGNTVFKRIVWQADHRKSSNGGRAK